LTRTGLLSVPPEKSQMRPIRSMQDVRPARASRIMLLPPALRDASARETYQHAQCHKQRERLL
jgi:hypothetical protein